MLNLKTRFCFFVTFLAVTSVIPCVNKTTADEIVIGSSNGYPPYYFEVDGCLKGLCIDIIDETAKNIGMKVIYKQYPWKRMLHYGENGQVDAVMPLFKTPKRETFLYFFENKLATEKNQFFIKKTRNIHFNGDLQKLKHYKIGIVDEYSYGSSFDKADFLDKMRVKDDRRLLELFAHDRFYIGLGNPLVVLYQADFIDISDTIVFLNPPVTENVLYIGFSKAAGTKKIAKDFSAALVKLKQTPWYPNLLKRYRLK